MADATDPMPAGAKYPLGAVHVYCVVRPPVVVLKGSKTYPLMEIASGSLYRLEGWELQERSHDLDFYRSKDLDWQSVAFEGQFLDPSENPDANQDFTLPKYVKTTIDRYYENEYVKKGKTYILFMIPQSLDEIEVGEAFPGDPNDFSADAESDYKDGRVLTFICKNGDVMDLGRFKMLSMLGMTWESALEESPNFFIRK